MEKHVLGLVLPSDPRWANIAEMNLEEILIDHAYCEQKAASTGISLIVQYPEMERLTETLTPVVAEEWSHFERVIELMKRRGYKLGPKRKDEYVEQLLKIIRTGGSRQQQVVEKLLFNALIEARSCERFRLLWKSLKDEELQKFYYELMVSEAGHYKLFLSLAKEFMDPEAVELRWRELLLQEAAIIASLEVRADRMH